MLDQGSTCGHGLIRWWERKSQWKVFQWKGLQKTMLGPVYTLMLLDRSEKDSKLAKFNDSTICFG